MLKGVNHRFSTGKALKRDALAVEATARKDAESKSIRGADTLFKVFADTYLRDHAALHKRDKGERDRQILTRLKAVFGNSPLNEIGTFQIEQWRQARLTDTTHSFRQQRPARPLRPATVNRELDVLRHVLTKAVEWGLLSANPALRVKKLRVENRKTRILTPLEVEALVGACKGRFRSLVMLALATGARRGELLNLKWEHVGAFDLVFLETKNGKARRLPLSETIKAILTPLPRVHKHVFANPATGGGYVSVRKNFERALGRAGIVTGDVTFHTLRHTALSRMIESGVDVRTVMEIAGHSSLSMLERYTHPTVATKAAALDVAAPLFSALLTQAASEARNKGEKAQNS